MICPWQLGIDLYANWYFTDWNLSKWAVTNIDERGQEVVHNFFFLDMIMEQHLAGCKIGEIVILNPRSHSSNITLQGPVVFNG